MVNVSKILRNAPAETLLWWEQADCQLRLVSADEYLIKTERVGDDKNEFNAIVTFYNNGQYFHDVLRVCSLFPSKTYRDWTAFGTYLLSNETIPYDQWCEKCGLPPYKQVPVEDMGISQLKEELSSCNRILDALRKDIVAYWRNNQVLFDQLAKPFVEARVAIRKRLKELKTKLL